MKCHRLSMLLALVGTVALAGCAWAQGNQTNPAGSQRVEDQANKASQDAKNYSYEHRAEYQQKLQAVLDKLNREIGVLERKAEKAGTKAQQQYRQQLPELRRLRDKAQVELRKVEKSTPGAWQDLKQGAGQALEDLRIAVDKAKKHFR